MNYEGLTPEQYYASRYLFNKLSMCMNEACLKGINYSDKPFFLWKLFNSEKPNNKFSKIWKDYKEEILDCSGIAGGWWGVNTYGLTTFFKMNDWEKKYKEYLDYRKQEVKVEIIFTSNKELLTEAIEKGQIYSYVLNNLLNAYSDETNVKITVGDSVFEW